MSIDNTTYRVLVEKLGGSNPSEFVGNEGELFFDPNSPTLKLSNGSTAGGLSIGGSGGSGISVVTGMGGMSSATTSEEIVYLEKYYNDYSAEVDTTDGEPSGGGLFIWDSSLPKTKHDGGMFISPTVPYNGTRANLVDFLAGTGETDSSGNGVWVRQFEGNIQADFFGCVGNKIADDQPSIQKAIDVCYSIVYKTINGFDNSKIGRYNKVQIKGECRVKRYILISGPITLYGDRNTLSYTNQDAGYAGDYNWQNQPVIWVDNECVFYSETGYEDQESAVVRLVTDQARIEGIVIDADELDIGTNYIQVKATSTASGRSRDYGFFKLNVIDPNDRSQQGSLRITTTAVQAAMLQDDYYPGFQLEAKGGDMSGVGVGTTTYTSITPSYPYQWDVISGTLPSGFAVSSSGWVTCVNPTTPGNDFIKLRVADAAGSTREIDLVFEVVSKYIAPPSKYYYEGKDLLPHATEGVAYSFDMELYNNDGNPHYWWILNAPNGITINQTTGEINGTPAVETAGEYKIKVVLTDQTSTSNFALNDVLDEVELNFEVSEEEYPKVFSTSVSDAIQGVSFENQFYVFGGDGNYTWSINNTRTFPVGYENDQPGYPTTSSPAPGLTLDSSTGLLSGTPTSSGNFHFHIRVTDGTGKYYEALCIFEGKSAERPEITNIPNNQSIPPAVIGQPYSYQITSNEACTFSTRSLPTGLTLSSTGLISGTPTGGTFATGVSLGWGCGFEWINVRNFRHGIGVNFIGPSNLHNCEWFFLNNCDVGFKSGQMYDSRFSNFFVWSCRNGFELDGGSTAITFTDGRIEYIHEIGMALSSAHENILSDLYFDTCGFNALEVKKSKGLTITNSMFYRSARRVPWRGKHYNNEYFIQGVGGTKPPSHIYLENCWNAVLNGLNTNRGSNNEGSTGWSEKYRKNKLDSNVRPAHSIILEDNRDCMITDCNLSGCTNNSIETFRYLYDNENISLKGNSVIERNPFHVYDINDSNTGKNLLVNASKDDFASDGDNENVDGNYGDVTLLLHGDDFSDSGNNSYNIINTNAVISTSVKKFGSGSLQFNGTNAYVVVDEQDNMNSTAGFYFGHDPFTIEMWIYPTANNVDQTILDLGSGSTTGAEPFAIAMNSSGNLILAHTRSTGGQTVEYTSNAVISVNDWTHIAVAKNGGFGGSVRVYINGVQDGSTLSTQFNNRFIISGYQRPRIGRGGFSSAADFFNGYMDEIRISKDLSRYGSDSSFTLPVLPYGDEDYGVLPTDTQIFKPQVTTRNNTFANGSYGVQLGDNTGFTNHVTVIRRSGLDLDTELRNGTKGIVKSQNPSYYWYNITKTAEAGAVSGDTQFCEFIAYIAKRGNHKLFNTLKGRKLVLSFYARSANKNSIKVFEEYYSGTGDDNYRVISNYKTEISVGTDWKRYNINLDFPGFETVRIGNDQNASAYLRFQMDDQTANYDWEIGGTMIATRAPYFDLTPYTE